jgi:hypothetical protein
MPVPSRDACNSSFFFSSLKKAGHDNQITKYGVFPYYPKWMALLMACFCSIQVLKSPMCFILTRFSVCHGTMQLDQLQKWKSLKLCQKLLLLHHSPIVLPNLMSQLGYLWDLNLLASSTKERLHFYAWQKDDMGLISFSVEKKCVPKRHKKVGYISPRDGGIHCKF